jgi:hypothetical protein
MSFDVCEPRIDHRRLALPGLAATLQEAIERR